MSVLGVGRANDTGSARAGLRPVASEADFRRAMTLLASGRSRAGIVNAGGVIFSRPFRISAPLTVPEGCDGITIDATALFPMHPTGVIASMFIVRASRVTIRGIHCASLSAARMFTSFVTIPSGVTISGTRVLENEVWADRVYVEESGSAATSPLIKGNDQEDINASHASPIYIRGLGGRVQGNLLADGGGDAITVVGGDCAIDGNDCATTDITTSGGSGGNRLTANTRTGTKTLHSTDVDSDQVVALIAAAADLSNWGSGVDGVMPSGAVVLTRDTFYTSGTPIAGDTLDPAGFRVWFSGHLDLSNSPAGWITQTGNVGGPATAGGAATGGLTAPGGAAGAVGGALDVAGTAGTSSTGAIGGGSGAGGIGGSGARAGGAGATASAINPPWFSREALYDATAGGLMKSGLGGGGGGGGLNQAGGGGASGAPSVEIRAKKVTRGAATATATISLIGGKGGIGATGQSSGGGGGGGGGGGVWIHCGELAGTAKTAFAQLTGGAGGERGPSTSSPAGGPGGGGEGGTMTVITPQGVTVTDGSAGGAASGLVSHTSTVNFSSTTDGTSFTSAALTTALDDLIVVAFVLAGCTLATPTVTDDLGGTYTKQVSAAYDASANTIYIYVRNEAAPAQAATLNVTIDCTGDTATVCLGHIYRFAGVGAYGSAAVRAVASDPNRAAGGTPSLTFPQAILTTNLCFFAMGNLANPAAVTPPASFTESADIGQATPTTGFEGAYRICGETSTTKAWGGTSASANGAVGIEIILPVGGAGGACEATL